ncbi:MAG: hypothetical protein E7773_01960 [Sphingomonas sp.]|uniref:hypothetical protein n=1 Tax=Sphingomonas sp. TaxID=28214 RepID=UPI00122AA8A7|nr:hypothetical protein [Sphingomonas sp.]THD37771.1 MAG: hypothetical protein E7773_01960 [Sphingomonas sp.]
MKQQFVPRFARAVAPLLCATAFIATPAFAQETPAAPPVVVTPPQTATVPPPPVVATIPDAATTPAQPAAAPAPRTATRSTVTRSTTRTTTARPAPVRAAGPAAPVVAAPAPQPATPPAEPAATQPAAPVAAAPAAPAPVADTTKTQSTTTTTTPLWVWAGGALAVLALLLVGVFALRRRRVEETYYDDEPYVEDTYVEPVAAAPVVEPLPVAAVAPRKEPEFLRRTETAAAIEPVAVAPDEVKMVEPAADEVADLTAGTAPVAERPWLEFAMRPVRAGTNVDEALVEIELTVGNAGSVSAKDVRISTFLLSSDPNGSEMERILIDPPADATTDPVTIEPGEGKRIDATLALLKADMGEDLPASFRPIVVADARYTLADGSEGRTSASFEIGVTPEEGEGLDPIELSRASMHDNVGAELHGQPQHA